MKKIPLTQSRVALVDDSDFEWLSQFKWYTLRHRNTCYAFRKSPTREGRKTINMHREILGLSRGDGKMVDHINRDGLDNRRENLRLCTHAQNQRNSQKNKNNTSGYKGVTWDKQRGKWHSQIVVNHVRIRLGFFDDLIKAAQAYDAAARKYHGRFARTNFSREGES